MQDGLTAMPKMAPGSKSVDSITHTYFLIGIMCTDALTYVVITHTCTYVYIYMHYLLIEIKTVRYCSRSSVQISDRWPLRKPCPACSQSLFPVFRLEDNLAHRCKDWRFTQTCQRNLYSVKVRCYRGVAQLDALPSCPPRHVRGQA